MTTRNENSQQINHQALLDDIRHELRKVYEFKMNPALVLDTIDILIHEHTGLPCVADTTERPDSGNEGLQITPPPDEDSLFRVVYVIDVNAVDAKAAAQETHKTMIDPDPQGSQTTIDLSQE